MKEDLMEAKDLEPKEEKKKIFQEEKNHEVESIKEEQDKEQTIQDEKEKSEKLDKKEELNKIETDKLQENEEEGKIKKKIENQKDSEEALNSKVKKDKNKQHKEDKIEKKQTKKVKKIIISIIIVAIVALLFSTVFALTNINNEKIISGVTIKGVEVSGLTKEEAIAKLQTIYSEKMNNNIMLQYEELESELNPTLMEVNYDVEKAVNEAYSL